MGSYMGSICFLGQRYIGHALARFGKDTVFMVSRSIEYRAQSSEDG